MLAGVIVALAVAWAYWRGSAGGVTLEGGAASPPSPQAGQSQAMPSDDSPVEPGAAATSQATAEPPGGEVYVHVSGAVLSPGVVCLPLGSRLIDGVNASGGLADDAATDYVNLAAMLADGTHVYIPRLSDIEALRMSGVSPEQGLLAGADLFGPGSDPGGSGGPGSTGGSGGPGSASGDGQAGFPVDINSADSAALQTVPGIGPVIAQRIIDYRSQYGPFARVEDLIQVSGIGDKKLAQMQPYLTCR
jgi:competence protein ComEA